MMASNHLIVVDKLDKHVEASRVFVVRSATRYTLDSAGIVFQNTPNSLEAVRLCRPSRSWLMRPSPIGR